MESLRILTELGNSSLAELMQTTNLEEFVIYDDTPTESWSPDTLRLYAEVEITFNKAGEVCRVLVQPTSEIEEPSQPPVGTSWTYEEYTDNIVITLLKKRQPPARKEISDQEAWELGLLE